MKYYEDLHIGEGMLFGPQGVSAEDIKRFAREYDPQPFHLDEAAGQATHFGGLAASGWHTAALTMRLLLSDPERRIASLGSPGFDNLRWRRPVRPGDRLRVRTQCLDKQPCESQPDRGLVRLQVETLNQDDAVVMSYVSIAIVARRDTTMETTP